MSRLLDRILTSCQRFRPSLFYSEAELRGQLRLPRGNAESVSAGAVRSVLGKSADQAVLLARDREDWAREHWLNIEPWSPAWHRP